MSREYLPVDVHYLDDPRVLKLEPMGRYVDVALMLVSKRTESDGRVCRSQARRECGDVENLEGILESLIAVGLWTEDGDELQRSSWLKWNTSRADLVARREKFQELGRKGGEKSGQSRRTKRDAKRCGSEDRSGPLQESEALREPEVTRRDLKPRDETGPDTTAANIVANGRQDPRFDEVVGLLVAAAVRRSSGVRNLSAYKEKVRDNILSERGEEIAVTLSRHLTSSPDVVADWLAENSPSPWNTSAEAGDYDDRDIIW